MTFKLKSRLLLLLLVCSYLLFTYYSFGGWWHSSLGTLLILLFSYFRWKGNFLKHVGLAMNGITIAKSLILACIIALFSFLLVKHLADKNNIAIEYTNWQNYYHDIFYVLNEEIVLGAIILFSLVKLKRIHPLVASIGLALFFSLIHYICYRWFFNDKGIIEFTTLTTLFLIGFVRNNLILQTGHIGYSWALHFGWIVIMFGSMHTDLDTNLRVAEPDRFNIYLSSYEMLTVSVFLATLSILYWIRRYRNSIASRD